MDRKQLHQVRVLTTHSLTHSLSVIIINSEEENTSADTQLYRASLPEMYQQEY
jgi:hypothetical protein